MRNPLVTVILPCYNCESFIAEALTSIQNQTYKNLEIIVIDDGSTDDSLAIISKLIASDSQSKIIKNERNLGLIETLNKGVALAEGQYIARMDADDISHLARIKTQIEFLTKHQEIDVLGTTARPLSHEGNQLNTNSISYKSPLTLQFSVLFTQPFFHGSIIAKAEILKNNPYDDVFKHSEDFELWNRLSLKSFKFANLEEPLYFYRINPNGVSAKFESIQIESHNLASKKYIEEILGEKINIDLVSILNNRPNKNLTTQLINSALKLFDRVDKKINLLEKEVELRIYITRQKIDILLQCAKRSNSIAVSFFCGYKLILCMFRKGAIGYLINKFLNK